MKHPPPAAPGSAACFLRLWGRLAHPPAPRPGPHLRGPAARVLLCLAWLLSLSMTAPRPIRGGVSVGASFLPSFLRLDGVPGHVRLALLPVLCRWTPGRSLPLAVVTLLRTLGARPRGPLLSAGGPPRSRVAGSWGLLYVDISECPPPHFCHACPVHAPVSSARGAQGLAPSMPALVSSEQK